ncbi:MAG: LD-carboxypeptidase [Chitinophagales bacterium]|nr:LD-carboxypeptidase [Chitinophagales bacterium]
MISPAPLRKGDAIGIFCPARKVTVGDIAPALDIIKSWGFVPVLGESIGASYYQFGGTDTVRAADLQMMLDHSEFKAILCARGGYGTVRIIDRLDFGKFIKHPKWLIGFSDATVLHSHIVQNFGIETLHASMPLTFASNTTAALQSLYTAITGGELSYEWAAHAFDRKGKAEGILVGGNLSLLYSLSGSVSDIDTKGKILFLEDIDEHYYHFDRMLMQLKRAGKLQHLAGLLIGGLTEMKDKDEDNPFGKTAEQLVVEHTAEYSYPVAFGFPAGHVDDNRALIMGRKVQLSVGSKNELHF